MANVFTPNGFSPVRRQDGASWSANMSKRLIAKANTHSFFTGDPVINLNTGYIDGGAGITVNSLPADGIAGIFVGCEYFSQSQQRPVWNPQYPGSDAGADITAYVIDDPSVVLQAWVGTGASSAAGGPAVLADVMNNIGFQLGTGNTLSGRSGAYVDYANKGTGITTGICFKIVDLVTNPPGANGTDITTAGNLVLVTMNVQSFHAGVTGV